MGDLQIRAVRQDDKAEWQRLYDGYHLFYERPDLPQSFFDQAFGRLIDRQPGDFHGLVAEADGNLLGLVHTYFTRICGDPRGFVICRICIPRKRRAGGVSGGR